MLREDRAWALVLAACEPLRGRVKLAVDSDTRRSVVSSYQWVELDVPEPDEQEDQPGLDATLAWVHQAREACVVIHTLASCVGFRGHENEFFWKRVFDHLSRTDRAGANDDDDAFGFDSMLDGDTKGRSQPSVNDAFRFFDDPSNENGSTFPRFRVKVPFSLEFDEPPDQEVTERYWAMNANDPMVALARMVHEARGREEEEEDEEEDEDMEETDSVDGAMSVEDCEEEKTEGDDAIESTWEWFDAIVRAFSGLKPATNNSSLVAIVNELLPYVDAKRYYDKPVEIGVLMAEFFPLKHMASKVKRLTADFARDAQRNVNDACADRLKTGLLRFPHVKLSTFAMEFMEPLENFKELQQLTEMIEACDVVIPSVVIQLSAMIDDDTFMRFIRSMMIGHGTANVQNLSLEFGKAPSRQVEIVFSAIPMFNVMSLGFNNARGTVGHDGWTWLAHGLFHPWTRQSRLTELDLRETDVTEAAAAPLRSVIAASTALYNLLHGVGNGGADVAQGDYALGRYAIVNVQPGTGFFLSSDLLGTPLHVFVVQAAVTAVIKHAVNHVHELDDVVCVVIPGRGHGWVAKSNVIQVKWEPCGKLPIRSLALSAAFEDPNMQPYHLGPLVEWVSYFDIFEWGYLTASEMLDLFRACRGLKHVVVQHCGDVFSTWTSETTSTDERLQSLHLQGVELVCYEDADAICAPSSAAWKTCLRELTSVLISTFGPRERYEQPVRQFFRDGYVIDHFEWKSCTWMPPGQTSSYEDKRIRSRSLFEIKEGVNDKAPHRMTPRACAAFISVIKHASQANRDSSKVRSQHMIGMLSLDVAKVICGFSTTDVERFVWMDDR